MAELFGRSVPGVNQHIKAIFREGELAPEAVIQDFLITASDGKSYTVEHYNLDVVISVGYRVKSIQGTRFRIWATNTLRSHILKGYTLNQRRLAANAEEMKTALALVQQIAGSSEITSGQGRGLIDVIARYTRTYPGELKINLDCPLE